MTDPDFPPMKLVSTVLGGGLAGRFFSELRDKQGLAYTTAAQEPMRMVNCWHASGFDWLADLSEAESEQLRHRSSSRQ